MWCWERYVGEGGRGGEVAAGLRRGEMWNVGLWRCGAGSGHLPSPTRGVARGWAHTLEVPAA